MEIERQYLAILDLTHRMLNAVNSQDWDALTKLESQRTQLLASIPRISSVFPSLDSALVPRITRIITEIEHENAIIVEQAQVWQKHVRILLRLDKPVVT